MEVVSPEGLERVRSYRFGQVPPQRLRDQIWVCLVSAGEGEFTQDEIRLHQAQANQVIIRILSRQGISELPALTDAEEADCISAVWKVSRPEVYATRARVQRRNEDRAWAQRQRNSAPRSGRMLGYLLILFFVWVGALIAKFVPMVWDLASHALHHGTPALLAVTIVGNFPGVEEVPRVPCKYCGRKIRPQRFNRPHTEEVINLYSDGCLCRLSTPVLQGMLDGDRAAFHEFRRFKAPWYLRVGEDRANATEFVNVIKPPLSKFPELQADVERILAQRQEQGSLTLELAA